MKILKFYLAIFIISLTNLLAQGNYPQIFSPNPHHNFGEILEGQIVDHEFEIVNKGDAELIIKDVKASCGCTAVQPSKKNLAPNEKTKIKVEFDSHGRFGQQKKYVFIYTNDPKSPYYQLSFDAVVVRKLTTQNDSQSPKLVINKTEYNFGDVEEGKVVETNIEFKNVGVGVLEIKDVKTSCGCTAVLLSSKKLQPGETGTIKIQLDTSNRDGQLTRTVTIYSNDPNQSTQVITLLANIKKRKS